MFDRQEAPAGLEYALCLAETAHRIRNAAKHPCGRDGIEASVAKREILCVGDRLQIYEGDRHLLETQRYAPRQVPLALNAVLSCDDKPSVAHGGVIDQMQAVSEYGSLHGFGALKWRKRSNGGSSQSPNRKVYVNGMAHSEHCRGTFDGGTGRNGLLTFGG